MSTKTVIKVVVACDKCHAEAVRNASGADPRTVLASARRSLARRDGWQLASRLFGPAQDLCPACQLPEVDPALLIPGMPRRDGGAPESGHTAVLYVPAAEPGVYEPAGGAGSEPTQLLEPVTARR